MIPTDYRDIDESLTDILIDAIFGYHCMMQGVEFNRGKALDEYHGKLDYPAEVKYPALHNIVNTVKGEVFRVIDSIELKENK